jgi:urease accessory protein
MRPTTLAALILVAAAGPAMGHAPGFTGTGLVGGLLHPVTVSVHVLVLVAFGFLTGQQDSGRIALVVMFALGLVAGLAAIALAAGPSSANLVLTAAALIAGAWTASARPLPPVIGWPLMSVAGAAIGLDSPPETVVIRDANLMLIGTGSGAVVALVVVAAATTMLRRDWQRLGIRIAGSWTAAAAMLVLALALAR